MLFKNSQIKFFALLLCISLVCLLKIGLCPASAQSYIVKIEFGNEFCGKQSDNPWKITVNSSNSGDVTKKFLKEISVSYEGELNWTSSRLWLSHEPLESGANIGDLMGKNPLWHRGEVSVKIPWGVSRIIFDGLRDASSFPSNGMDVRVRFSGDAGVGDAWFWQDHGPAAPLATQLYQLSGKVDTFREHSLPQTALVVFKSEPKQPGNRLQQIGITHPDIYKQLFAFDSNRTNIYLSAYGFDHFGFSGLTLICYIH